MKLPNPLALSALLLASAAQPPQQKWFLLPAHAQDAPAQNAPAQSTQGGALADETPEQFKARQEAWSAAVAWKAMLEGGRARRLLRPDEPGGWLAEGTGAYMLGDVDTAITSLEAVTRLDPAADPKEVVRRLDVARRVRRNYPGLQLEPVQFVDSEATLEAQALRLKARQMLASKSYDEIESAALALQQSRAANALGYPHLEAFFSGLYEPGERAAASEAPGSREAAQKLQGQLAAWQAARPKSALARLAAAKFWTMRAFEERGTGYVSTITPEMEKKMEAALARASQAMGRVPQNAGLSPLAYSAKLYYGMLSGGGRAYLDRAFAEGTAKFPYYQPFYNARANHLLPRWYGEAGDWQAMAKARADQIGGEEGDIFYVRVVMFFTQAYGEFLLYQHETYDVARAFRGLDALLKRHPDSIALRSAQVLLGVEHSDYARAKSILSAPEGNLLDSSWQRFKKPAGQRDYYERRLFILAVE